MHWHEYGHGYRPCYIRHEGIPLDKTIAMHVQMLDLARAERHVGMCTHVCSISAWFIMRGAFMHGGFDSVVRTGTEYWEPIINQYWEPLIIQNW